MTDRREVITLESDERLLLGRVLCRRVLCHGFGRALGRALRRRAGRRGSERVVGQPVPNLAAAEQRDAEIAADLELLAVGAELHERAIDRAVARIHDRPVLVSVAVALHALDEGEAEHRLAALIAFAFIAYPVLVLAGLEEHLHDSAL